MSNANASLAACKAASSISNTGIECSISLGAIAGMIALDPKVSWSQADMADLYGYFNIKTHASKSARGFPLFGNAATISWLTNTAGNDVTETADDGSESFIRYGFTKMLFGTRSGGLCFAKALQSFNNSGYSLVLIDEFGKVMMRQNQDGSFSGMRTQSLIAVAPTLADLKAGYRNNFAISISPAELVNNGVILNGDTALLDLEGLINVVVTDATGSSVTKLKVNVGTSCGSDDLIARFGSTLAVLGNFIVTNAATGVVVTPAAIAIVGGHIELTGTFVSGQSYFVDLAPAATLLANQIEGYESVSAAKITIP